MSCGGTAQCLGCQHDYVERVAFYCLVKSAGTFGIDETDQDDLELLSFFCSGIRTGVGIPLEGQALSCTLAQHLNPTEQDGYCSWGHPRGWSSTFYGQVTLALLASCRPSPLVWKNIYSRLLWPSLACQLERH